MKMADPMRFKFLILVAFISLLIYDLQFNSWTAYLNLFVFTPLGMHLNKVMRVEDPRALDPELKKLALSTFVSAFQ